MAVDGEVLEWLREAVTDAESWESVRAALQRHDPEGEDTRLRPALSARRRPPTEERHAALGQRQQQVEAMERLMGGRVKSLRNRKR